MALAASQDTPLRLLDRLEALRLLLQAGCGDENAKLVLSTIHSSKGLEYDRVYLLDAIDGVLPAQGAQEEPERMEE